MWSSHSENSRSDLTLNGINVGASIDPANLFLNGPDDVRSAYWLKEVATEFDLQGLELDWAGVCWGADLRYQEGGWSHHAFKVDALAECEFSRSPALSRKRSPTDLDPCSPGG